MADEKITPDLPEVAGPTDLVVGDGNLPEAREPQADVVKDTADAQVVKPREDDPNKVNVHEVSVTTDERVDYVIVPDAGRGSLDLPIHRLDAKRPEDVFAAAAQESSDSEERAPAPSNDES